VALSGHVLDAKCCETIICETISIARKQPAPKTPITIEELTISPGSRQKRVLRAGTTRLIPGYAHATYFSFPNDTSADSVTTQCAPPSTCLRRTG
jgi:hypothetical protein